MPSCIPPHEWMNGWTGGGMWFWAAFALVIVGLLVVVISKQSKK